MKFSALAAAALLSGDRSHDVVAGRDPFDTDSDRPEGVARLVGAGAADARAQSYHWGNRDGRYGVVLYEPNLKCHSSYHMGYDCVLNVTPKIQWKENGDFDYFDLKWDDSCGWSGGSFLIDGAHFYMNKKVSGKLKEADLYWGDSSNKFSWCMSDNPNAWKTFSRKAWWWDGKCYDEGEGYWIPSKTCRSAYRFSSDGKVYPLSGSSDGERPQVDSPLETVQNLD